MAGAKRAGTNDGSVPDDRPSPPPPVRWLTEDDPGLSV